jgi:hypothetical protein
MKALNFFLLVVILIKISRRGAETQRFAGRILESHAMARNFQELRDRMSPEQRQRSDILYQEKLAEMLFAEICKWIGLTPEEFATVVGNNSPVPSTLESQDDMQISTLRRLVEALGGKLDLVIHLPGGDLRITQFNEGS